MYIVIGLGNPGKEYEKTAHNAGFLALDILTSDWKYDRYIDAETGTLIIGSEEVLLTKPYTFMNLSGDVITALKKKNEIIPAHVIVTHDDIDLPLGTLRISYDRGPGGHNGVKSISEALGTKEFIRIRIGVSRLIPARQDLAGGEEEKQILAKPNVTGKLSESDYSLLTPALEKIPDIITTIITEGKEKAMTKYN
ncbi:MAG: aminoacyl-tRNA hydrolase [Candidatus Paceibacterota bacterium]|jgi:PTH1 family peptidyl-tRNA hydrolase